MKGNGLNNVADNDWFGSKLEKSRSGLVYFKVVGNCIKDCLKKKDVKL